MDVQQALKNLADALNAALESAKTEGAQAFEAGEFEEAQRAANQGRALGEMIAGLEQISAHWEGISSPEEVAPATEKRSRKSRSRNGEPVVVPILQALESMGGKGQMEEVLDRVLQTLQSEHRSVDEDQLDAGQTVRWRESAQSTYNRMVKLGFVYSSAPPGVWQITPQGRLHLFEQQK
jgi:hypothetical protein